MKKIFSNPIPESVYRKALGNKERFVRKYGDDSQTEYHLSAENVPAVGDIWNVRGLRFSDSSEVAFDEKSIVIGNIRMGFGHYRISMAIASAAHAMGYDPYWFDLHSLNDSVCGKVIAEQNKLYSMGSRLSQQVPLFNKTVWEPLNSEGFRQLSYNCSDQLTAELMTPVFRDIPRDIPFIAAHVWPAQAAVHAGLENVINVIPDNWPMALHLAEGSLHTVQTPSAYMGYRMLRGMDKDNILLPMPEKDIEYTGHYIDAELVDNIEKDNAERLRRRENGSPMRWLMSVGGAGAQKEIFVSVIHKLIPYIRKKQATLLINVGDHMDVWEDIKKAIPNIGKITREHFDDFGRTKAFAEKALGKEIYGIHAFCHSDIFAAVYTTNLLIRCCDVLITKPGELSFYPVPKLMIKRVGGHEAWGAIRAAEIGDGTYELDTPAQTCAVIGEMQQSDDFLRLMCRSISDANKTGIYNGAYNVIKLAEKRRG